MPHSRTILTFIFAWLLFFIPWTLFLVSYGYAGSRPVVTGLWATGTAAVLSLGVWWLTGRHPWPERWQAGFVVRHLLAALFFIGVWTTFSYLRPLLFAERSLLDTIEQAPFLDWYFLMGGLLYVMVVGVCYAVRNEQRAKEQAHIAARAEALAAKAKLQTLQAQLNPHFLFNALHSLSTLIRPEPARAEQAVEQLGDLLRYALDEQDTEAVLFSDEWAFTRDYLALQRLRFEERLHVETSFEEGSLSCLVPPFTLQPLVENAVTHSIAPRPEGGKITINARHDGSSLILSVHDDGLGTDIERVHQARGHGLRTLQERLYTLYGSRAKVDIETALGEGFGVVVTLPDTGWMPASSVLLEEAEYAL